MEIIPREAAIKTLCDKCPLYDCLTRDYGIKMCDMYSGIRAIPTVPAITLEELEEMRAEFCCYCNNLIDAREALAIVDKYIEKANERTKTHACD